MSTTTTPPNGGAVIADTGAIRTLADIIAAGLGFAVTEADAPANATGLPEQIPIGYGPKGEPLDLKPFFEKWRATPERKTGTAKLLALDSFIELTNRHKTGESVIFANTDWKAPAFTAVVDYHEAKSAGAADNMRHRLTYTFPLSEEWKVWVDQNGKPMSQADFAAFLEDRIADLSSPTEAENVAFARDFSTTVATPSELISLSRGLAVNVEAKVKQAITLQSGETSVQFEEQHLDAAGKPIIVPGIFLLAIAPFFMGEKIRVPVRLRYRVSGGKLAWFYQIYRPDQFVTERIRDDLDEVRAQTELPCFEGTPEASGGGQG